MCYIPGGDFLKGDGTGSFSIHRDKFLVRAVFRELIELVMPTLPGREFLREAY